MRTLAPGSLGLCQGRGDRTILTEGHLSPPPERLLRLLWHARLERIVILGVCVYTYQTHMPTNGRRHGTRLESERSVMGCHWSTSSSGTGHVQAEIAWETCRRRTGWRGPSEDSQLWPSGKESPLGGAGLASKAPTPTPGLI